MNRAKIFIFGFLLVCILVGLFLFSPTQTPNLSILLRCVPDAEGELFIEGRTKDFERKISVSEACSQDHISFKNYKSDQTVLITFQNEYGESIQLNLQENGHIQSGNDGNYYIIIDVTSAKPFIAIGTI